MRRDVKKTIVKEGLSMINLRQDSRLAYAIVIEKLQLII